MWQDLVVEVWGHAQFPRVVAYWISLDLQWSASEWSFCVEVVGHPGEASFADQVGGQKSPEWRDGLLTKVLFHET